MYFESKFEPELDPKLDLKLESGAESKFDLPPVPKQVLGLECQFDPLFENPSTISLISLF